MSTALATPRRPSFDFIPAAGSRLRTEQQPAFRSSSLRGNDGFSRAEDDDQDIMELLAFPPPPPRFPSPSRQHPPPSSLVAARSFLPTRSPPRPPLSQTSHSTASATSSSPSLGLSSLDGTAQAPVIEFGVAEGGLESTIYLLSTSTTSLEPTAVSKKDRRRGLVVATSFDALASASPSTPPSRRRASTHDAGASPNNSTQSMSSEGNASPSVSFSTDLSRSDATTTATSIASRASKRPTPSRHVGSCHMRAESAKSTLREMMGNPAPNPPHALPPTLPLFSARPIHPASVDVVRSVWDTDDDSAPSASSKSNKTRKKARMEKARTEKMERKRQKRRRGSENVAVEALPDVESMLDGPRFSLGALLQELTAAQERTLKDDPIAEASPPADPREPPRASDLAHEQARALLAATRSRQDGDTPHGGRFRRFFSRTRKLDNQEPTPSAVDPFPKHLAIDPTLPNTRQRNVLRKKPPFGPGSSPPQAPSHPSSFARTSSAFDRQYQVSQLVDNTGEASRRRARTRRNGSGEEDTARITSWLASVRDIEDLEAVREARQSVLPLSPRGRVFSLWLRRDLRSDNDDSDSDEPAGATLQRPPLSSPLSSTPTAPKLTVPFTDRPISPLPSRARPSAPTSPFRHAWSKDTSSPMPAVNNNSIAGSTFKTFIPSNPQDYDKAFPSSTVGPAPSRSPTSPRPRPPPILTAQQGAQNPLVFAYSRAIDDEGSDEDDDLGQLPPALLAPGQAKNLRARLCRALE